MIMKMMVTEDYEEDNDDDLITIDLKKTIYNSRHVEMLRVCFNHVS